MALITWDADGSRMFETGVDHGTLYLYDSTTKSYGKPIAWNGLSSVSHSPEGGEANDIYADNIKYLTLMSTETLKLTIEAYTYPDEFAECDGTAVKNAFSMGQQTRKKFAFSYRTKVGNDVDSDAGYKYHLVFGCLASPSEKQYQTVSDSPEAITFSWEVNTTPAILSDATKTAIFGDDADKIKPASSFEFDTTKLVTEEQKALVTAVENVLYTSETALGKPDAIAKMFAGITA